MGHTIDCISMDYAKAFDNICYCPAACDVGHLILILAEYRLSETSMCNAPILFQIWVC